MDVHSLTGAGQGTEESVDFRKAETCYKTVFRAFDHFLVFQKQGLGHNRNQPALGHQPKHRVPSTGRASQRGDHNGRVQNYSSHIS